KTANDYIGQDGSCLDVTTSTQRKTLYDKVMRSKFGVSSDAVIKESMGTCNFQIKRVSKKNLKNTGSSIGTSGLYIGQNDYKNNSTTITSLSAQEGRPATIKVNDQS